MSLGLWMVIFLTAIPGLFCILASMFRKRLPILSLYPALFFFTDLNILGFGSPDRLMVAGLVVATLLRSVLRRRSIYIDRGLCLLFVAFTLSFLPSCFHSSAGTAGAFYALASHCSMGVFVLLIVKSLSSRRSIVGCVHGISVLVLMIVVTFLAISVIMKSPMPLREGYESWVYLTGTPLIYTVMSNPTFLSRILLALHSVHCGGVQACEEQEEQDGTTRTLLLAMIWVLVGLGSKIGIRSCSFCL